MRVLSVLLALVALGGCAGVKTYPTDATGNVTVRPELDRGVRATVDVHFLDAKCEAQHQGRAALQVPATTLALPTDRLSYVAVTFDTSSFLRGSASTSAGTLIRPRPGYSYQIDARYHANIYDVRIVEIDRRSGARRELARRDFGACRGA